MYKSSLIANVRKNNKILKITSMHYCYSTKSATENCFVVNKKMLCKYLCKLFAILYSYRTM